MKQIPWAFIIPSTKMARRRFVIKVVPEMADVLHRDALHIFKLEVIRVALTPVWLPVLAMHLIFNDISLIAEKVSDLCYSAFNWLAKCWNVGELPREMEGVVEIPREVFIERVTAMRERGEHVPKFYGGQ